MKAKDYVRRVGKKSRKIEKRRLKEEKQTLLQDNKGELSVDWTDLNSDILYVIYKKFDNIIDFMRFRAVCKWWNDATPLSEHPLRFPLLLDRDPDFSSNFTLYSPQTGRTHRIQVPKAARRVFVGQSQGYLITYKASPDKNDSNPTLLNPITGAALPLPFGRYYYFMPVHIGGNPIRNADDVVIQMTAPNGQEYVGFRKNGEDKWTANGKMHNHVEAYHKGRIFDKKEKGYKYRTSVIDITSGKEFQVRIPSKRVHEFFCIGDGAGTMLGIKWCWNHHNLPVEKCWFEVYRLDEEQKPPRWVKLSNIGDLLVFLDYDGTGFCLSVGDFRGIKGNCIYFTKCNGKEGQDSRALIGRNELGKRQSEVIGEAGVEAFWFMPNLQ